MIDILFNNRQSLLSVDEEFIKRAVGFVLRQGSVESGEVSLALVDNPAMHAMNRQYLAHDYPTDVLSFVLHREESELEGEIIVSAEYAAAEAAQHHWPAEHEILLYFVHGALHLIGYDDQTDHDAQQMRAQERAILAHFGLTPPGR